MYSGYNDYRPEFDTKQLDTDDVLQAVYDRRPTAVAVSSKSSRGKSYTSLSTTGRNNMSSFISRVMTATSIDNDQLSRPMSAVRGAGYVSNKNLVAFDPLNLSSKVEIPPINPEKELSIEDKIKLMEKNIMDLIDESCIAEESGAYSLALEKAKEASSKEHNLIRFLEQSGHESSHNFDLTFSILLTVAHQYVTNEMYTEALNMYQAITKNKVLQNGSRLKINMGNIYVQLGQYDKAIKMYRWALDHVSNTNKDLRAKILHNIGIVFVKMKQFDEACSNFEYILQEKADFKAGYHALICHYLLGNTEMMKKHFQSLLNMPLEISDNEEKYSSFNDDPSRNILLEVIRYDSLSTFEKKLQAEVRRSILISANLLSRVIDDDFSTGYNKCLEMIKVSQYSGLADDLEINKAVTFLRNKNIRQAVDTLKLFDRKESRVTSIATTNLAFIHLLQGDVTKAEMYGLASRNSDLYNASAYVNIGNCMFLQGEYDKAKEFYDQALENDSSCIEALYNAGLTKKRTNQLQDALDCFMKLQMIIVNNAEVLYQIGHINELLGDTDQALQWYLQLIGIVPSDPEILQKIGEIYDNNNDKQQAFHYYFESYRIYPSNLTVLDWLGAHFVEKRSTSKAVTYFEKAALMQPNEPKWKLLVGSCHRRGGNYQLALQIYKETHQMFPENIECLKLLIRMGTELGLKETSEFELKLKSLEKLKEVRRVNSSRRSSVAGRGSSSSLRIGSGSSLSSGEENAASHISGPSKLEAAYSDPLGPMIERPRTSAGNRLKQTISDDNFTDDLLTDDLLPE